MDLHPPPSSSRRLLSLKPRRPLLTEWGKYEFRFAPSPPASGLALSSLWDLGKSPYVPEAPRGTRRASHQHIVRSE